MCASDCVLPDETKSSLTDTLLLVGISETSEVPDETESSLTNTRGISETSEVIVTPSPRYSKRPSDKIKFSSSSFV